VARDETGGVFFCAERGADLFCWIVLGDAAPDADTFSAAETIRRLPGVLFAAAGGAEFVFDEPFAGGV